MLALGLRLASALCFATMAMLVKYAGEMGLPLPEIIFWRQFMALPLIGCWLWWTGGLNRLRTDRLRAHAARALSGTFTMTLTFTAAMLLPLSISTTLGFTTPLFAVLISGLFMAEKVGPWRWTSVLLGFLGVLIIGLWGAMPHSGAPVSPVMALSTAGLVAGLFAGLGTAIINFQVRDLGRTEEPVRVVFWFAAFGSLASGCLLPFFASAHDAREWLMLTGIGTIGLCGQLCMTAALRVGAVASIVVMDYSTLIWATLFGWLVWDTLPGTGTWLGAPLIIAAGLIIAWRQNRLYRTNTAASPTLPD